MKPAANSMFAVAVATGATLASCFGQTYTFATLTKYSSQGREGEVAAAVRFRAPYDIAVDQSGNIYIAEWLSHTIRKVTPAGRISTLAGDAGEIGSADGHGSDARFDHPTNIAADGSGNLYVADNNTIRKISPAGVVTTLAGSAGQSGLADAKGAEARFEFRLTPSNYRNAGIAVDVAGNVFVADVGNRRIRKITPDGSVTTFAGSAAQFNQLERMAFDRAGNLLVIDIGSGVIHKISPSAEITTLSLRDGRTSPPRGLAIDNDGNVYLAYGDGAHWDYFWSHYPVGYIAKLTPGGERTIFAGDPDSFGGENDGVGSAAEFKYPQGLAIDRDGNLYVADTINYLIRKVTKDGAVTTLASLPPDAPSGPAPASQVVNVSVRAALRAAEPLVVGLEVQGGKPVLLRAVGPGLRPFLPAAVLAVDPRLELHQGAGTPVRSNDNWGGESALRESFAAAGAFALESNSSDAALLHTLEGQNTLQATVAASGVALFEMYDLAPGNGSRVGRVSARHRIGAAADDRLFAGFTISGSGQKKVLLRGLGPGLVRLPPSAIAPLARATLSVFGSDGQLLADNDGWPSTLASLFVRLGAAPIEFGSKDAALLLDLAPGSYIAVLRGANRDTGEGMLEIFDLE